MARGPNTLRWTGRPGHYEVYYLTLTDPQTGVGVWIRYTMVAPLQSLGQPATCALWFLAMDPRAGSTLGRKATFPIGELHAETDPFELRIAGATLSDRGMAGSFEDVAWELAWVPSERAYEPVRPILEQLGAAKTVLVLPHANVPLEGTIGLPHGPIELAGARGGQAHLWGSKHASSWAWVHCNDLFSSDGERIEDAFVDAVSATVRRFGRQIGPSTPVVGRIGGEDFRSTSPLRIVRNQSRYELTSWRFEAIDGARKLIGEVEARRDQLAGVTYHDPDGELAYCYNSETASLRLQVYERGRGGGWSLTSTLVSTGRAHFEYAQRTALRGLELLTQ